MRRNVQSMRKLFRNEIIGERDNPVCLVMNQIELQIEVKSRISILEQWITHLIVDY